MFPFLSPSFKSELKNTVSISIPLIASYVVYSSSGFISVLMVAHLGKAQLAACVLVSMLWWTLCTFFFGILSATSVLVSQQFGARNYTVISKVMGQAFWLAAIGCIPMMLILWYTPAFLLHWSSQPANVIEMARRYLHTMVFSLPGLTMVIVFEQFLTGIGQTRWVLAISLFQVPFEISMAYIFIFGKLGLPALGIAGIGCGFAIAYTLSAIVLGLYLEKSPAFKIFRIYNEILSRQFHYIKELLKIGWPIGCMTAIEVGAFTVATFFIAQFSTTALAAHQIALQFLNLSINVVFGMMQTVSIRVGHAVGRNDSAGIKMAIIAGISFSFFCMLLISAIFVLFPTALIHLDINTNSLQNVALIKQASTLLMIIALFQLCDNFRLIEVGALRGLKDTRVPMLISFISFWLIGLSTGYILGFWLHLEDTGIWWGLTAGILSGAIILAFRLKKILRKVDLKQLVDIG